MAKHVIIFRMGASLPVTGPTTLARCKTCGWEGVFNFFYAAEHAAYHHIDPAPGAGGCESQ